jgi:putative restriction endonuclease
VAPQAFIALTDKAWFDHLSVRAEHGRIDEVNFWSPKSTRPMKMMVPGEPIFFRLKDPNYTIVGYGFFAHFAVLGLREAWTTFGEKNGDPDLLRFLARIGEYRGIDLDDARSPQAPLGCTILRDAVFWPPSRWIPWGADRGWARNIVRGKAEDDPERAEMLLAEIRRDHVVQPEELVGDFQPLQIDERELILARTVQRVGQGTFRARLLDAYDRRCAVTGERTEPVLDAAHIQPYLGPRSNHVRNGLILSKEFHTLFDLGYVTVDPDYRVHVSPRLRADWRNGRRFYEYDRQPLAQLPVTVADRPSQAALEWHMGTTFLK